MKLLSALLLSLALLVGQSHAAGDDPTVKLAGVTDLTPDNFDAVHSGKKAALIEFYAPWCGHCKRLVPEYSKLGEKIASDPKLKNRVLIAKVDADSHRSLGEKFGVRGFPTLKWFPRGKPSEPVDYTGGRSLEAFLKFIEEKLAADAGFARVDALVPLAQKFQAAAAADRKAVLAEAEKVAAGVAADDKENAALYVRFMKKAIEKGDEYIAKELARLEKMAEKAMSAAKADEVSRKVSVLQSFLEAPAAAAEEAKGAAAADSGKADPHAEGEEFELEEEEEEVAGAAAAAGGDDDEEVYADGLDEEEDDHAGHDHAGHDHGAPAQASEDDDPYDDSEL